MQWSVREIVWYSWRIGSANTVVYPQGRQFLSLPEGAHQFPFKHRQVLCIVLTQVLRFFYIYTIFWFQLINSFLMYDAYDNPCLKLKIITIQKDTISGCRAYNTLVHCWLNEPIDPSISVLINHLLMVFGIGFLWIKLTYHKVQRSCWFYVYSRCKARLYIVCVG